MIFEKTALTIAGSDSGGGAGIQADLKTFSAHKVYGASVITSVTAQNTCGVTAIMNLPNDIIQKQISAVLTDFNIAAIKTGMLATPDIIRCVANSIREYCNKLVQTNLPLPYIIIDPVMVSTSGQLLMQENSSEVLKTELLGLATLITPNIDEAETLAGIKITCTEQMKQAIKIMVNYGCKSVLLKGGHLNLGGNCIDILFTQGKFYEFSLPFIKTGSTHGTGCTLASAITANLVSGENIVTAVKKAKEYLHNAILKSRKVGSGSNPVFHEWQCS